MISKRQVVSALRQFMHHRTYTVRRGLARGLKRKGGLAFIPVYKKPSHEEQFFASKDLSGQTVYDIGGFEGVLSIFFGRAVGAHGKVVVFEPHPENYRRILENVALNHLANVRVRQMALGKAQGQLLLTFLPSELESSSLHQDIQTHLQHRGNQRTVTVEVDSLDHQRVVSALPRPNFIKIDVEGFELAVLQGMHTTLESCRPQLFIEIHGVTPEARVANLREVVALLEQYSYNIFHLGHGYVDSPEAFRAVAESRQQIHMYCTSATTASG